ncbi:MAG: M1 family aminopeptidase [Candidatus Eisenbacteria bacterium]
MLSSIYSSAHRFARCWRAPLASLLFLLGVALPAHADRNPAAGPFPEPAARLRLLAKQEARSRPAPPVETLPLTATGYDIGYSYLDVDVSDTANRRIYGAVNHAVWSRVSSLAFLSMDLRTEMTVDSVKVNGTPAAFSRGGQQLLITLPTPLLENQLAMIRIVYHGQPQQLGFGLQFETHSGSPFIWNLSEPDGCRYWWPTNDRPDEKADSMDIRITVPNTLVATSNGTLVSTTNLPGNKRAYLWHVSYPIAPYLVSCTAGNFVRLDSSYPKPGGGNMPLWHYVFPDQVADGTEDFNIASDAIDAFAARYGEYPFLREKYGISVFGWGGGMEHQTNTSYGWFLIDGFHSYDWIYVHELSHQWWGDDVTCATWADSWLNEGFASYSEAIWAEHQGGASAYRSYMTNSQAVSDPSGPVYNYPDPFDGNTIYNKGAWVVHMLRGVLGDAAFFGALADYRAGYHGRSVTTAELQASLLKSTGRDLTPFFNEWVYGVDRPKYKVSSLTETISGGVRLYVHLQQTQSTGGFFTMPVRIRVQAGGQNDLVLENDPDHEDLVVDLPTAPTSISVDPDNWILRTVSSGTYGLNLITTDLAPTNVGTSVSIPLVAKGGTVPYTWSAVDALPPGIGLNPSTGVLFGTPTTTGSYAFRVKVQDSASHNDTQKIRWTILPPAAGAEDASLVTHALTARPNPASRSVRLALSASARGPVTFEIFDLAGRLLASHHEASATSGWTWGGGTDGGAAPAGVYFARARYGDAEGRPAQPSTRIYLVH